MMPFKGMAIPLQEDRMQVQVGFAMSLAIREPPKFTQTQHLFKTRWLALTALHALLQKPARATSPFWPASSFKEAN
jgi:hypothetical protein